MQVFDHDASGSHDLIGSCQASLAVLQEAAAAGRALPLVNPKKAGKPGYANSGELLGPCLIQQQQWAAARGPGTSTCLRGVARRQAGRGLQARQGCRSPCPAVRCSQARCWCGTPRWCPAPPSWTTSRVEREGPAAGGLGGLSPRLRCLLPALFVSLPHCNACLPAAACWPKLLACSHAKLCLPATLQAASRSTFWWRWTSRPATATRVTPPPCTTSGSAPRSTKVRVWTGWLRWVGLVVLQGGAWDGEDSIPSVHHHVNLLHIAKGRCQCCQRTSGTQCAGSAP